MLLGLLGDALLAAGVPVHQVLLGGWGQEADASLGLSGFGGMTHLGVQTKDGAFWGVFFLVLVVLVVFVFVRGGGGCCGRGRDGGGQGFHVKAVCVGERVRGREEEGMSK